MNWGTKIVISFIVFMGIIATLVTISMRQDVNLVAKDYYVQEIAYQDQIDRINNKNALSIQPAIEKSAGFITVKIGKSDLDGEVHFFRPSDATLDKKYKLQTDAKGNQSFIATDFEKGLWRVKISWKADGKEFYSEHSLVL